MGNCMERFSESEENMKMEEEQQEGDQTINKLGFVKEISDDDELVKGGVKVKIVLTKEELEWLMFQLKNNQGKKLEEILGEIERGRLREKVVEAWKPSLESIMETPEVHDHMDR
ncbi:hypothetical protein Ddye_002857 [Dipteronia dyeriana]|uniref:Uncharacterized protein n=1 Tax=Dipteronia dyeriana TaxID=168575 RepID=A0AAD9XSH5_9ROSI|nr:hypothetical protein Ddye_002857 [Dipteronia dyeriana]